MRNLPLVFPISLAVLLVMGFFTSAWAVAEGAVSEQEAAAAAGGDGGEYQWHQKAAIVVCPLH
ncbi:MAG: hypothetical protein FJ319_08545 [SAR202 cluster bacterium]|nr:hypothetical protein [SAR202 cluster bacterium]